ERVPTMLRPVQGSSIITIVFHVDWRAAIEQQPDDEGVAAVSGPMQTSRSVLEFRVHLHSSLQKKSDHLSSAELTGPGESVLHLVLRSRWLQAAIFAKKVLYDVQPPDSGRAFEV